MSQETTFYVEGMHCPSCEILVEKTALQQEGVTAVDATIHNKTVTVNHEGSVKTLRKNINRLLHKEGYTLHTSPPIQTQKPLLVWNSDGTVSVQQEGLLKWARAFGVVLLFAAVFYTSEQLQLGKYVTVDATASLGAFFLLGVVAGVSSCAALVGGLLLSLTKQWHTQTSRINMPHSTPHVLFHSGRLVAFFVGGAILGTLGNTFSTNLDGIYPALVLIVSAVMVIIALQMMGVQHVQRIQFTLPSGITSHLAQEETFQGKYMPFAAGAGTFFLPCGFTLIAQGVALTTGSFMIGGWIMLAFALGTLPMLAGISFSGLSIQKNARRVERFSHAMALVILFFALYNINGQLNVLGLPSLSDIHARRPQSAVTTLPTEVPGTQTLELTAEGFDYIPTSATTLVAGVPTTMVINNKGILGCGAFISARGLFPSYVELKPGINEIDLGSPKPGSYKVTCSMGMVAPVTVQFKKI